MITFLPCSEVDKIHLVGSQVRLTRFEFLQSAVDAIEAGIQRIEEIVYDVKIRQRDSQTHSTVSG